MNQEKSVSGATSFRQCHRAGKTIMEEGKLIIAVGWCHLIWVNLGLETDGRSPPGPRSLLVL